MKRIFFILAFGLLMTAYGSNAYSQVSIKTNVPVLLLGGPNIGTEITLSQQFTVNGDFIWLPFLFKKSEETFNAIQMSADVRYYPNPRFFYNSSYYDGLYFGPYAMYGNFNIGMVGGDGLTADDERYDGWGISGGISVGYKLFLSTRFRLDINVGIGYAHMQYDTYPMSGQWSDWPTSLKDTKDWIGPTKFGVHLVYNLFR